ncbi:tyrosine-type recombinase/integrase [Streptomyces hyaluromycini]|uniref:Tyrosine-type recombinase/integrase n=1 Tax=Streptomyces hyaluromycini TaxID=1377993 RepID=A0ABV1WS06_9ACTN
MRSGAGPATRPAGQALERRDPPAGRVFTTRNGEPLVAANVLRDFEPIVKRAGLQPEWTPRELRHSFVSLLSDHGIPLEHIALLVTEGAEAMDGIFTEDTTEARE